MRIQEFSSEGVQLSENFDKQKKKKKKKKEEEEKKNGGGGGGGGSFPFQGVWFKSTFKTIIYIQIIFGRAWSFVQLQAPLSTHTDDMVFFIL